MNSSIAKIFTRTIDSLYLPVFRRVLPLQVFRYAVCGGVNLLWNAVMYYAIYHYVLFENNLDLGIVVVSPHVAAMCIVFPITFFNGFWLNRNVAFNRSALRSRVQLFRYAISVAGSLLLNYLLIKLFVEVCCIYATPSMLLTSAVCTVYSFLMSKYFTFREQVGD